MPLDIDGAGRSKTLACLPTARGTVAPTRGQIPGGVLLGTSTGPYKVNTLNLAPQLWWALRFFAGGSQESLEVQGLVRAIFQILCRARGPKNFPGASQSPTSRISTRRLLSLLHTSFSRSEPSAYTNEKGFVVDQDGPN